MVAGTLNFRSQIEPEADAHTAASDTHEDATNKPTIGSGVANSHIIDSDIHRNKLKGHEGVDGQNRAVSTARTLPATENQCSFLLRHTQGQRSRLQLNAPCNVWI